MYELKSEQFSGPIEKLLELIEERKMEITSFSLAEITADFLDYIEGLKAGEGKEIEPRLLADFIAVASQLLLIKSKALLPSLQLTEEEEEDIKGLEDRLAFYRRFKPAISHLKKLWEQGDYSVSRPLFSGRQAFFYPSENIKIGDLLARIKEIFSALEQFSRKSESVKSTLVSLEEKIEEIMKRAGTNFNFGELAREKPRSEIVVLFLALLHLLAKQLVAVEQKNKFEDIMIERKQT